MKYETREEGGVLVIAFEGDVDLESSPVARKALLEAVARGHRLLVDLSAVGYMDSSGVASLVEALQGARKRGCAFAMAGAGEGVRRVIKLARLDRVFTLHDTLADGLRAMD